MMVSAQTLRLAKKIVDRLRTQDLTLVCAESCTGGLLGAALTSVPGASDVFLGSLVTYGNAMKTKVLGIPAEAIKKHGAVSSQTAAAMAVGAQKLSKADIAVSITGIAGPGGGSKQKPVGLVYLGIKSGRKKTRTVKLLLKGVRAAIRAQAVHQACEMIKAATA